MLFLYIYSQVLNCGANWGLEFERVLKSASYANLISVMFFGKFMSDCISFDVLPRDPSYKIANIEENPNGENTEFEESSNWCIKLDVTIWLAFPTILLSGFLGSSASAANNFIIPNRKRTENKFK